MTVREIREALCYLDNQNMTVKELRAMLFNVADQDAEIELRIGMWAKLEARQAQEASK